MRTTEFPQTRTDNFDKPPVDSVKSTGIRLQAIDKSFGSLKTLSNICLDASEGEIVAIVGPSGCGKTTLLEIVCGLTSPDSGSVQSQPSVLMPQGDLLFPWFNALDNAALSLRIAGHSADQARKLAHGHFVTFGLEGFEDANPNELSGGMRQRVAFLRTLLTGKPVLCLDEPFGALDALTRMQMQEWLALALKSEPRTVLLVTHDVEEAVLLADRIVLLSHRPATCLATLTIDIPRPRTRSDNQVVQFREKAITILRNSASNSS